MFTMLSHRGVTRSNKVGWTIQAEVWGGVSPPQSRAGVWGGGIVRTPEKRRNFPFEMAWRFPWYNSLQLWCVHAVTNQFYYCDCWTCTAISNLKVKCTKWQILSCTLTTKGLHWQTVAYANSTITAKQQITTLEWIDSLSSTLHALPTLTPQQPSKLSGSASIISTSTLHLWSHEHLNSPVKTVTFDTILVLLLQSGKVTTGD